MSRKECAPRLKGHHIEFSHVRIPRRGAFPRTGGRAMKKLQLESIVVESFTTAPSSNSLGTVKAYDAFTPTCPITMTAPSIITIIEPPGECCDC
jgi:hypothetical protein